MTKNGRNGLPRPPNEFCWYIPPSPSPLIRRRSINCNSLVFIDNPAEKIVLKTPIALRVITLKNIKL